MVMLVTVIVSWLSLGLFISILYKPTPINTIWGTMLTVLTAIGYLTQAVMGIAIFGSITLTWVLVGVWMAYAVMIYSEHLSLIY